METHNSIYFSFSAKESDRVEVNNSRYIIRQSTIKMMRQRFQFQILLLLAPILASSAFTIYSGRTTALARAGHSNNNQQLVLRQQQSTGPEWLSIQAPQNSPSVKFNPCHDQRSHFSPSTILCSAASADSDESSSLENNEKSDDKGEAEAVAPTWKRVMFFYKYNKDGSIKSNDDGDGLTFKQKLAKMGLSVLLSYGFVSNMSYCVTVSLA
jgi:hypothetical protein